MKVFVKVALLFFVANAAFAQNIEIGVKGSYNLSNISKFQLANAILGDSKTLPSGGGSVFVEIPLANNLSFRPEVGYTRRGAEILNLDLKSYLGSWGAFLGSAIKPTAYLDYIDVPLLLKYKIDAGAGKAYVLAGPGLGFLVDSGLRINLLGMSDMNIPLNYGFQKFEFSGHVGAGYELPVNDRLKVFVEAKYQQGFTNIIKDQGVFRFNSKNNNIGISAGLSMPIGK